MYNNGENVLSFFKNYLSGNDTHSIVNSFNDWSDPATYVNLAVVLCPTLLYGAFNFFVGCCVGRGCRSKRNQRDEYQRLENSTIQKK
jgi:hypothetical protein